MTAEPSWDNEDECFTCGHSADEHDRADLGGGCGVCGDCPGYLDADLHSRHFPWHYTEFGVVCACGLPMDRNHQCAALRAAAT